MKQAKVKQNVCELIRSAVQVQVGWVLRGSRLAIWGGCDDAHTVVTTQHNARQRGVNDVSERHPAVCLLEALIYCKLNFRRRGLVCLRFRVCLIGMSASPLLPITSQNHITCRVSRGEAPFAPFVSMRMHLRV